MDTQSSNSVSPVELLNRELLALSEAALAISSDLSLEDTLRRIVRAAAELVDARYAALGVPDEAGERLVEFITTGLTPEEEAHIPHRPRGEGILGVILREGQSLRLRDLTQHPRSYGFPPNHPPMRSFLGVPIIHKGKRLGNLYLTEKRSMNEFSADDQRLIELLAAHAGVAIENARLHEQVQSLRVIEERQRIGMDLHDGVIQSIYAAGLMLEYVKGQLAEGDVAGAGERLQSAMESLNTTIRDIRAYILDLRPRRFDGEDLIEGLRQLLAEFKANTLITVELNAEPSADKALTPAARLTLFLIAQEALSNVARHSRASHVVVQLSENGESVVLALRDNGRGFDLEMVKERLGHGVRNMRDRATALGGELLIHSSEGGAAVRVSVPKSGAP